MATHLSQETYARSIEVFEKWSLEHDYPNFRVKIATWMKK